MNEMNPRVMLGGNNPPLEESIVLEFDAALREYDFDILARVKELEAKAEAATGCEDAETAARYGEHIKAAVAAKRVIEAERETLNRPLLNAQRALMGAAKFYTERLDTAEKRIRGHLDAFTEREKQRRLAEERERQRKIDEENARQAAILEAERRRLQAIADEIAAQERARLQKIADEEAARERARLQAIADEQAEREKARLQAIEDERAAQEQREAQAVQVEAEQVVVEAETVVVEAETIVVEAAPIDHLVAPAPVYAPIRSDRGVLVGETETWHVEIENIRQVPDLYLKNPAVIEVLRKVIAPSVRGKTGLRAIKGCRIYSTTKAAVR